LFFKNVSKIDLHIARLTKKTREKTQIVTISNKARRITKEGRDQGIIANGVEERIWQSKTFMISKISVRSIEENFFNLLMTMNKNLQQIS
jgi:hypothetical protein